jgi:hypothetical protein
MYAAESSYLDVYRLVREFVRRVVPEKLFGRSNLSIFMGMLKEFISMKRYENYKIEDFVTKMDIFTIPWFRINYNKKYKKKIITRGRKKLSLFIVLLFNKLLIPLLKYNFYIT